MQCNQCGATLHDGATFCGCGWKKFAKKSNDYNDFPRVACAHETCGIAAMCRIQTKTGWANLCWRHYDEYFSNQAIDNLDKYGMEIQPDETREEHVLRMRRFVKDGVKQFGNKVKAEREALLKRQRDALVMDFGSDVGTQA